jgi:hypothetical protein
MDITPFSETLRRNLAAAAAGSAETQAVADRLAVALDPAVRLVLIEALSQAAAEITAELPSGSVEVRLRGLEPTFVVDVPPPVAPEGQSGGPSAAASGADDDLPPSDDDDRVARITLRLPENLKTRVEDLAARSGQSLNTWLVFAIRSMARTGIGIDIDLGGRPDDDRPTGPTGRRMTGWV